MTTLGVTGWVWKAKVVAIGVDRPLELWKLMETIIFQSHVVAKSYVYDRSYD